MSWYRARYVILAFAAEVIFAGGNAVAIRFSNRELAPVWGAGLRFALAAVLLLVLMQALGLMRPRGRAFLGAVVFGLLQFAGAFGFFYYALVEIHAGLGQTFLALVPLATLLLAAIQRQERLRAAAVFGTLLAFAGIALVSVDPQGASIPPRSLLAVLLSVLCFAQALVVIRRMPQIHPVALNAVGMTAGAFALLVVSFLLGEAQALPTLFPTWIALGYVVAAGSVVVFLLHVYVAQRLSASRAAYVMVMIPFVAVFLSSWLDAEPVTGGLLVGGLLVLAGVYFGALRHGSASWPRSDGLQRTGNHAEPPS